MAEEYQTYEDLVGEDRHDAGKKIDFKHGEMFKLPDWVKWWTARDAWGKVTKKEDPSEHSVDIRFLGFLMDEPDYWPKAMASRVGGLVYTFPFVHHRDLNDARHICLDAINKGPCPRCDSFRDCNDRDVKWDDMKHLSQRQSGIMFGYVDGGEQVYAFEFTDVKPGKKGFDKDPTIFQRLASACRGAGADGKPLPKAKKIDPLFYTYAERAQVLRLSYTWSEKQAGKGFWQLLDVFKVDEEDGAPSKEANAGIAKLLRPWEWLDVEGERERMLKSDGATGKRGPNYDGMTYGELMQVALDGQMTEVLEQGYEEDETVALRAAIKKAVTK